jgi:hypothetical protein
LNDLARARGDATQLAENGNAKAGFEWLNAGLESALQLPVEAAWRNALIGRWRETCDYFAEKHGIRLG